MGQEIFRPQLFLFPLYSLSNANMTQAGKPSPYPRLITTHNEKGKGVPCDKN